MSATLSELEECVRRELPSLDEAQAQELASIIEQLVTAFHPERVYAFGSRARGDARPDSDVDLMVVVTDSDEPAYRRAQAAYTLVNFKRLLPLDVLVWTRHEYDDRLPNPATLPGTINREGKLLYATR
jgi:predicted nucleotidyltransferase